MTQTVSAPHPPQANSAPLLEVSNLAVEFRLNHGVVRAVNGISYRLAAGKTLAILGESGSGKSVSAQAVMGIIDTPPGFITSGSVRFQGTELIGLPASERRRYRGEKIAMIFQDALSSLNPVYTVGYQIGEMFRRHRGASRAEAKLKAIEMMERVKIPLARERANAYPHQFSGGMRQRVMIAMAIALDPDILIADEPTTALDVTVQAQIMGLLDELQAETGMGMILITHDLGVVAEVADEVAVMYAGKIVEQTDCTSCFARPAHPYTFGLMHSIPRSDKKLARLNPIKGTPPDLMRIPPGCSFHPRCEFRREVCFTETPQLRLVAKDRLSACHFAESVLAEEVLDAR